MDTSVLLDHTQDKVIVIDEDGTVLYANDALTRILGWTVDEFVGENALEYIHPADLGAVREAFRRTVTSDTFSELTVEYRYRTKDDSWVWFESRMSNARSDQLDGYVVSSRDITDRLEAERQQEELTSRLHELSSVTDEVLWMFDGDFSDLLFVNSAYEAVYGQPVEAIESDAEAFIDAVHPNDVPDVENAIERLTAGEPTDMEYRVNPAKNYKTWVWAQAQPIFENGDVVRITGFSREVTDRHRRKRQLSVMDNLLRHNLRNDVNIIVGNTHLIDEMDLDAAPMTARIRNAAEALLESAEKEREIVDVLNGDITLDSLDLTTVVEQAVKRARDRYSHAEVDISVPTNAPVNVLSNVRRAVFELVENAIVHSESERPSVSIRVQRTPDSVELTIEDDAPPIPEIEAYVLENPHAMTDIFHSTGVGLWLVYWIVELSDGDISVSSATGSGNRIRVVFPDRREDRADSIALLQ